VSLKSGTIPEGDWQDDKQEDETQDSDRQDGPQAPEKYTRNNEQMPLVKKLN